MPSPTTLDLIRSDVTAYGDAMHIGGKPPGARYGLLASLRMVWGSSGLRAVLLYRLAHGLRRGGVAALPTVLYHLNLSLHGIDIAAANEIGPGLYIPHPVGTVIHCASIGSDVTIVSGVTIGMRNEREFPTIGDRVYIGAGARVLGGLQIGCDVAIGANAVVLEDVPDRSIAVGVPARIQARGAGGRTPLTVAAS